MFDNNATGEPSPDLVSEITRLKQMLLGSDVTVTGSDEDRTRAELIDPLLRVLGWNDQSVITRQYRIEYQTRGPWGRRADYSLHPDSRRGQPIAFIEAKR